MIVILVKTIALYKFDHILKCECLMLRKTTRDSHKQIFFLYYKQKAVIKKMTVITSNYLARQFVLHCVMADVTLQSMSHHM